MEQLSYLVPSKLSHSPALKYCVVIKSDKHADSYQCGTISIIRCWKDKTKYQWYLYLERMGS